MSRHREDLRVKDIPSTVVDPSTNKKYAKGRFLGKGGFAKCYELTDMDTNIVYAGKIVSKALLQKPHQKSKMTMEIDIHRSMSHKHVVCFHGFFEDDSNIYILLELCRRRSLMELHKRRKAVTEPEARYFMKQIVLAIQYMHGNKIIHRDLKLGNLFLNDEMEIKVGDFGLATRVGFDGERKKTLCGTPNYIAPEVLAKKGHSYEVDTWSLGCIMYTLLVGKPPFETTSLKDTYMKIKRNDYHIPSKVSPSATSLIERLLKNDPMLRPSIATLLHDEFFSTGLLPPKLPTTCLTMAPRFAPPTRKPLTDRNDHDNLASHQNVAGSKIDENHPAIGAAKQKEDKDSSDENQDYYLPDMHKQLSSVLTNLPKNFDLKHLQKFEEAEDPAAIPVLWVSKWVDYSDKYGLGYQLCDGSVGVLFNDSTRLLLQANGENLEYIDRQMKEHFMTFKAFPESLTKKVTLLKYFRNYMMEHLLKAGASMVPRESDNLARLPYLTTWQRTRSGIVLHLSNGTLQINFFADHTKVIICPLMGAISYIDDQKEFRTFRLSLIEQYGCRKELFSRMKYAKTMVERLMEENSKKAERERKSKGTLVPVKKENYRVEGHV